MPATKLKKWKLLSKRVAFSQPYARVEEWLIRLPNGEKKSFMIKGGGDFVLVCGITTAGKILIIKQYYINIERKVPALVAGFVDTKEKALATAQRELLEETGYVAGRWVRLGTSIKGKYMTGTVHHFLALGAHKVTEPKLEPAEDIEVCEVSRQQFTKLLKNGELEDAFAEVCAWRALDYINQ